MALTWDSRRVQWQKQMDNRLRDELLDLASRVGQVVSQFASEQDGNGKSIIPNRRTTRDRLKMQVWSTIVKPYFIGAGDEPLIGSQPQSPYMRLIRDGVEGAIRIQAERQIAIIQRHGDPDIVRYLTEFRPTSLDIREITRRQVNISEISGRRNPPWYDAWHLFVNPNGYRLSDNGWNTSVQVRVAIDALLDQHIPQGTSAVEIAKLLEPYLWPSARGITTRTPYGQVGSYWARRLARTEISAAAGRSVVNMSIANPFVDLIDWRLSGSHKHIDICDLNADNGPYPVDQVPQYPAHPHCLCAILPRTTMDTKELNAELRRRIRDGRLRHLQGAFNLDWLIAALLGGWFVSSILDRENESFTG